MHLFILGSLNTFSMHPQEFKSFLDNSFSYLLIGSVLYYLYVRKNKLILHTSFSFNNSMTRLIFCITC